MHQRRDLILSTIRIRGSALLIATALVVTEPAAAAQLTLPNTPYNYTVIDQDIVATLTEFGSNTGTRISVSKAVRGRVQGRLPELTPRGFLDRLSSLFNLQWYFDGSVLHVSTADEAQTRLLVLGPVPFERLQQTLSALSITDERFEVQLTPGANVARVAWPPRFVALVEQTQMALVAEEQARLRPAPTVPEARPDYVLQVFRGSQAQFIRNGRTESVVNTAPPASEPPPASPRRAQPGESAER